MANPKIELTKTLAPFEQLEDPGSDVNKLHPLVSVVMIGIMAALAGAGGPTGIVRWAKAKFEWLKTSLDLPHDVPAKDCFRRVFMALDPLAFQACFYEWIAALKTAAEMKADHEDRPTQTHIAVDGKTLRRSHDKSKGLGALHSVSAWASEFGLSLAQVATDEKSNEIKAITHLLELIDVSSAVITIDAMGTQKEIAEKIVDSGADYVLTLKENHPTFYQAVAKRLDALMQEDFPADKCEKKVVEEKGHGRKETRIYVQAKTPKNLKGRGDWKGLLPIGMAMLTAVRDGKTTYATRDFISSLKLNVDEFARAVRSHWSVENSCHRCLDMTFREDESRIRHERARESFAWLNRFTLSLLKQEPSKMSVAMKRRSCAWDDKYLLQVLTGSTT